MVLAEEVEMIVVVTAVALVVGVDYLLIGQSRELSDIFTPSSCLSYSLHQPL